jgi:hypothetical protein
LAPDKEARLMDADRSSRSMSDFVRDVNKSSPEIAGQVGDSSIRRRAAMC